MEKIKVEINQVWEDNDCRVKGLSRRRVRIEGLEGDKAICTNMSTGKTTKIKLSRFVANSTGYKLVSDGKA